MKLGRAIGFTFVGYLITVIIGALLGLIIGFDKLQFANLTQQVMIVCDIVIALMVRIIAVLYFRSENVAKGALQGLYLGIIMIVMGFVFDIVFRTPIYIQTHTRAGLLQYYETFFFGIAFLLVLIIPILTGKNASRQ